MTLDALRDAADRYEIDRPGTYAVLGLRLTMGWILFHSGLSKLADGLAYPYAATYLSEAVPVAQPEIAFTFPEVIGIPGALLVSAGAVVVEPLLALFAAVPHIGKLVILTELFVGTALLLGAVTRLASLTGAFLMLLFYYGNAEWEHGLLNGDAVYLFAFLSIAMLGAGRVAGLDARLRDHRVVRDHPHLKYLLS